MHEKPQMIEVGAGEKARQIAVRVRPGSGAPVIWMGGFKSDMMSTKAIAIDDWCAAKGRPMIRMDYAGHGESSGRFADFVFSDWLEDAQAVIGRFATQPPVIVGSSMGGWLAIKLAKDMVAQGRPRALGGLVLIAPACDFTEALMWPQFPDHVKAEILSKGMFNLPSAYSPEPTPITKALIEDGRNNLVLGAPFMVGCPVHILQGRNDPDVPWQHALKLIEHLPEDPVTLTMIQDGDHRLSRPQDIDALLKAISTTGEQ